MNLVDGVTDVVFDPKMHIGANTKKSGAYLILKTFS